MFRLGVVHHNVQRGAAADDENLRDADRLDQFLGSSLNLLLHGHTHNSKIGWINPHLPVLSTGSAALTKDARPEEIPNQYQIIRIWPDRLERWTRRFAPGKTRWEGDTSCSEHGDSWQIEHKVAFEVVNATFPVPFPSPTPRPKPDERNEDGDMKGKSAEGGLPRSMSFLDRVAQVCKLRVPGAEVHALRGDDPKFAYLLVTVRDQMSVQQYPVGVCEMPITGEYLDGFLSNVDAKYRAADPGVKTELVHTGGKAPQELIDDARRRGIRLLSFVEYQGLIDFSPYQKRQKQVLESDRVYPPSLYVSQRMRYSIGAGAAIWPESQSDDALETASGWLTDDDGRFVLVLANFGSGKTFLLRKLALRLGDVPGAPAPILIEMRDLQRARTLDELIAQHLVARGEERIDIRKFRYMLETGKITLLFDGFDELAQRVTYDSATDHFDTLLQAASGQAKVVVTSRTQHFESEKQVKTVLLQRAEAHPGLRLCHLQPFNEEQIRGFLTNLLGDRGKAEIRLELIREVQDLLGLSENPRMLSFIAGLEEDQLREAKDRQGKITSAELYRLLLKRWLEHDVTRDRPKGAPPTLSLDERWEAVTQVALAMWPKVERTVRPSELSEALTHDLDKLADRQFDAATAAQLVGARTLLVRDAEGLFSFVHQSVLEWLVANRAAEQLKVGAGEREAVDALTTAKISPLMADFFISLAGDFAEPWAQNVLAEESAGQREIAKANALLVLERLGKEAQGSVQLAQGDLRGQDLSGRQLRGANLAGADLTEARLVGADLTQANLKGACLVRANLTSARLGGAGLDGANATSASLLGADLRGAGLARVVVSQSEAGRGQGRPGCPDRLRHLRGCRTGFPRPESLRLHQPLRVWRRGAQPRR